MSLGDLRRGFLTPAEASQYFDIKTTRVQTADTAAHLLLPFDSTRISLRFRVFSPSTIAISPTGPPPTVLDPIGVNSTVGDLYITWAADGGLVQQGWHFRASVAGIQLHVIEVFLRRLTIGHG